MTYIAKKTMNADSVADCKLFMFRDASSGVYSYCSMVNILLGDSTGSHFCYMSNGIKIRERLNNL